MYEYKEYTPNDIIKVDEKNKHDEDKETDDEDDDAFLAKFDEYGRLIEWKSAWSQGTVFLPP